MSSFTPIARTPIRKGRRRASFAWLVEEVGTTNRATSARRTAELPIGLLRHATSCWDFAWSERSSPLSSITLFPSRPPEDRDHPLVFHRQVKKPGVRAP